MWRWLTTSGALLRVVMRAREKDSPYNRRRCKQQKFQQLERLGANWLVNYITPMNEIVNLRRVKKAKARALAEAKAEANRISHGRTKAEKKLTKAQNDAAQRKIDGHKRDDA